MEDEYADVLFPPDAMDGGPPGVAGGGADDVHPFTPLLEQVLEEVAKELERREKLYRGARPAPDLKDRTVILVDDGLATGSTMLAAVRHVRAAGAKKVIVAVPDVLPAPIVTVPYSQVIPPTMD